MIKKHFATVLVLAMLAVFTGYQGSGTIPVEMSYIELHYIKSYSTALRFEFDEQLTDMEGGS